MEHYLEKAIKILMELHGYVWSDIELEWKKVVSE